jgi:hypothetical protein
MRCEAQTVWWARGVSKKVLMQAGGARIVRLRTMWGRRIRTGTVGVATIAAGLVLMVACVDVSDDDVRISSVSGEPSSRLLSFGINTCNADLSAEVEETAEEVRIRVHAENNTMGDCADSMRLTLDDDLGNRRVIDDRTGAELRVSSRLAEPGVAGPGDPVQDGDFTLTVTAIEDGRQSFGGPPATSVPRGQFVLVYVTMHNDVLSPRPFAEEYQHLFDGDGRKYEGYIVDRGDLFQADINPDDTVAGVLVFDIPSDAEPAWIELHGSPSSDGVIVLLG